MSEPNHTNEQGTESFGDRVLEALGTALGVGLFLLNLWLFWDLYWNPRLSIIDWLF